MEGNHLPRGTRVTGSLRPDEEPADAREYWTLGSSVALLVGALAVFAWVLQ